MRNQREIYPPAHRFTIENLREILQGVLKGNTKRPPPEKLSSLAFNLNQTSGLFAFAKKHARESDRQAHAVKAALGILMQFFAARREACARLAANSEIVQREKRLYNHFYSFERAMREHSFDLDMDGALLMAPLETWRQIAELIAGHFRHTMEPQIVGNSNGGPLPRFVATVIPLITGEQPTVPNVAKHLKDCANGKRRRARLPRLNTGTLKK